MGRGLAASLRAIRDTVLGSGPIEAAAKVAALAWFGWHLVRTADESIKLARVLAAGADHWIVWQILVTRACTVLFLLLLIVMFVLRPRARLKSRGAAGRVVAVVGAFLFPVSVEYSARLAAAFPEWQSLFAATQDESTLPRVAAGVALFAAGYLASAVVLLWLGRSFSVMPEARRLVTSGPYRWVRHPLYATEMVVAVGIMIQVGTPFATALGGLHLALQVARARYEERVLAEAFPEYAGYKARTRMFIPWLI